MQWQTKARIQKALSNIPGGENVHLLLQRKGGGLRFFERECEAKIQDWKIMAGHLQNVVTSLEGLTFLEIGTGWYPTLPFCNYLSGVGVTITMDITRHLQWDLTIRCLRQIENHLTAIAELSGRSEDNVRRAHAQLVSGLAARGEFTQITEGGIDYQAPADARRTGLKPDTVDVVFSNSTMEHIPVDEIIALHEESMRVLRNHGLIFHSVNCGDHYSYTDTSVTQLNYLQYSDEEWKKWNNKFLYQNRLRAKDLVKLAEDAGFEIVLNTARPSERRRTELKNIHVSDSFRHYTPDELCITSVDFIGRKP